MAAFYDSTISTGGTAEWRVTNVIADTTATASSFTWSSWPPTAKTEIEVFIDPKALKLQLAREASKRALVRARAALRAALESPSPSVPPCWRQPQKPLYVRPVSMGRVCSGSSRYRVQPS